MPTKVVEVTSKWNKDKTCLTVFYDKVVKLKNKVAKRWLSRGLAVTLEEANWVNSQGRSIKESIEKVTVLDKSARKISPNQFAEALGAKPITKDDIRNNPRLAEIIKTKPPFLG